MAADDSNPLTTEEIDNKLEVASRFIAVDNIEMDEEAKNPTATPFTNLVLSSRYLCDQTGRAVDGKCQI